jgi:hypothetical protein
MPRFMANGLVVFAAAALAVKVLGAEPSFYERFKEASGKGFFLPESSLVDTNNSQPLRTNAPVSYAGLTTRGELGGIKLGMTMSKVVAAWGKPRGICDDYRHCGFCTRLYYGAPRPQDLDLGFNGDRLVWIRMEGGVAGAALGKQMTFDNGLSWQLSREDCQKLLGAPAERIAPHVLVYQAGEIHTTLLFGHSASGQIQHLDYIDVCLGRPPFVEPDGAANGSQPTRSQTNSTPSAAGSRR